MAIRWRMLAILFFVRTTMAFQFQAVAAVSPLVGETFGVGLAEIGLLIGLYLAPGIAIALPGGALGRILGDKRGVALGLVLMIAGGVLAALAEDWNAQIAARLIAGTGGVILNVLMSKMVTDWFAGREIATAMGIFVNSWPFGIALALIVVPPVALSAGLTGALWGVTALAVLGLVVMAGAYRSPGTAGGGEAASAGRLAGAPLLAIIIAGLIWGLYNAGLGMVFGFAPAMLVERGWSIAAAGSSTSVVLWCAALSIPVGGVLADRTGRPAGVVAFSVVTFGGALYLASVTEMVLPVFVAMGLLGGLGAGPIMSLAAQALDPGTRAVGMGIFYTCFYLCVVLGPVAAGWLSDWAGSAGVALGFGAVLQAACLALLAAFVMVVRRARA